MTIPPQPPFTANPDYRRRASEALSESEDSLFDADSDLRNHPSQAPAQAEVRAHARAQASSSGLPAFPPHSRPTLPELGFNLNQKDLARARQLVDWYGPDGPGHDWILNGETEQGKKIALRLKDLKKPQAGFGALEMGVCGAIGFGENERGTIEATGNSRTKRGVGPKGDWIWDHLRAAELDQVWGPIVRGEPLPPESETAVRNSFAKQWERGDHPARRFLLADAHLSPFSSTPANYAKYANVAQVAMSNFKRRVAEFSPPNFVALLAAPPNGESRAELCRQMAEDLYLVQRKTSGGFPLGFTPQSAEGRYAMSSLAIETAPERQEESLLKAAVAFVEQYVELNLDAENLATTISLNELAQDHEIDEVTGRSWIASEAVLTRLSPQYQIAIPLLLQASEEGAELAKMWALAEAKKLFANQGPPSTQPQEHNAPSLEYRRPAATPLPVAAMIPVPGSSGSSSARIISPAAGRITQDGENSPRTSFIPRSSGPRR
ncbi:hypothetical protein [Streptomyces bauhiniae]